MRNVIRILALTFVISGLVGGAAAQYIGAEPPNWGPNAECGVFCDALRPYGDWVWIANYGWCWTPYNVPIDWQPYSEGRWEDTDQGWYWDSDEPWGWATYHYGNWFYDNDYGWCWYPGTTWAPAWVSWRYGDNFTGWAPIPPRLHWRAGFGFDLAGIDFDDLCPPFWFVFVDDDDFFDRDLRGHFFHRDRDDFFFHRSKGIIDLKVEGNRIINRFPVENRLTQRWEKANGKPVPRFKLGEAETLKDKGIKGNELRAFKPDLKKFAKEPSRFRNLLETPKESRPPEVTRHFQEQQQLLQKRHLEEKNLQQLRHRNELQNLAPNTKLEELQKLHENEQRFLEEQQGRERSLLERQHERERNFSAPNEYRPRFNFEAPSFRGQAPSGPQPGRGEAPRGGRGKR